MDVISGYTINEGLVKCPECSSSFSTRYLAGKPAFSANDLVEADFHIVLGDSQVRSALVAVCAHCGFGYWTTRFALQRQRGQSPGESSSEWMQKYAKVVQSGRQRSYHPLDLALFALNGSWCARDAGASPEMWLQLAAFELNRALRRNDKFKEHDYWCYMMGELCRQLGYFEHAISMFAKVRANPIVMPELVRRQTLLAIARDARPSLLPPHLASNKMDVDWHARWMDSMREQERQLWSGWTSESVAAVNGL